MSEADTGRQYDRWLQRGSLSGRGYDFIASVPGSMLVNTPIFRLDKNLMVKPGHRVLDIGCGRGSLLQVLSARLHFRQPPVGVDLSAEMLRRGRREIDAAAHQIDLAQAAGSALPFADGVFDIVTCSYVLKHLEDRALTAFLGEIRRVLKPGAYAVLWEFAPTRSQRLNAWHRWLLTRGVASCNLRTYSQLAAAATSSGFEWVENARLRPFLLPPIPRISIVAGKAPEEWRERTGPGRIRRAAVDAMSAGASADSSAPDTTAVS